MVCGRSTYRLDYSLPKVQLAITTGWHYCALHIERSKDRRAQCFNLPAYPLLVNVIFFYPTSAIYAWMRMFYSKKWNTGLLLIQSGYIHTRRIASTNYVLHIDDSVSHSVQYRSCYIQWVSVDDIVPWYPRNEPPRLAWMNAMPPCTRWGVGVGGSGGKLQDLYEKGFFFIYPTLRAYQWIKSEQMCNRWRYEYTKHTGIPIFAGCPPGARGARWMVACYRFTTV